ncbi:MAG: hypothetical protein HY896_10025 [Deltaproteobacteria bacterium]|nr:hypothetical protein [Deltaproteobacteria bacterium]
MIAHLTLKEMQAYVRDLVSGEEAFRAEVHMASCDLCAGKVRRCFLIKEWFGEVWEWWTSGGVGPDASKRAIQGFLPAYAGDTRIAARIASWVEKFGGKVRSPVRFLLDARGRIAKGAGEELENIFSGGPNPLFATVSQGRIRGAGGSEVVTVETGGPPWMKITASAASRTISVASQMLDEPWPIVLLVPEHGGEPLIGAFRAVSQPGGDILVTEFEGVPDGEYRPFLI